MVRLLRPSLPGAAARFALVQPGFWFSAARNTGVWGHLGLDAHRSRSGGETDQRCRTEKPPPPWRRLTEQAGGAHRVIDKTRPRTGGWCLVEQ